MAERVRNTAPVKINEFRIGTGADPTDSFIELYNAGASPVDLSGWTFTQRPTQQPIFSTVKVPAGTRLGGHGFYVLGLSTSGLAAPASAGDTTLNVRSTTGLSAGDTVQIDTGAGAETRKIASVGTPASRSTPLWQPLPDGPYITIPAGSRSVPVTDTRGFAAGQKVMIGSGDDLEVATVTAVGTPGTQARLSKAAAVGDTNIKVSSTSNISVGDRIRLDIASAGHGIEWVTVAAVGSSGSGGTGLDLTAPLKFNHADNLPFSAVGTGISFTPATKFPHTSDEPVQGLGTGITLDSPLSRGHDVNAVVRDAAVTSAGFQGTPSQWFGGPALSTSAGSMVLRDAAGNVSDSLNYGQLVDPWAAEGYQAASGAGASGCKVGVPGQSGPLGQSEARFPDGADADSNCTDFRTANGSHIQPTPGTPNFVATQVSVNGDVSGTVPATLALSLGTPASFGQFTPGAGKTYDASTTANVISTAGDATLSVADPSGNATGHLVNGSRSLPQALTAKASSAAGTGADAFAPVGGSADPTTLLTYAGPTSNDAVSVAFQQAIGATDPLRTGSYAKTLTFTLSTTNP
jgi:hypothetical protein